jgi:hypothetical protein
MALFTAKPGDAVPFGDFSGRGSFSPPRQAG